MSVVRPNLAPKFSRFNKNPRDLTIPAKAIKFPPIDLARVEKLVALIRRIDRLKAAWLGAHSSKEVNSKDFKNKLTTNFHFFV